MRDSLSIRGLIVAELHDRHGGLVERIEVPNLITQVGDQWYGERAAGVGSRGPVTGMKLGTGTTNPSRTGAGAHVGAYLSNGQASLSGTPTSSLESGARRITYTAFWPAGTATHSAIAEVILTVQSPIANNAGDGSETIARGLFVPTVNKESHLSLTVNWHHDLEAEAA